MHKSYPTMRRKLLTFSPQPKKSPMLFLSFSSLLIVLLLSSCSQNQINSSTNLKSETGKLSLPDSKGLQVSMPPFSNSKNSKSSNKAKESITSSENSKGVNNTSVVSTSKAPLPSIPVTFVEEGSKKNVIDKWINYYTKRDRERFVQHLKNGNKYRALVESILKQYQLPSDLYYLGIIESGYNLKIKSKAMAVGPWQFIKGTAVRYGLKVNHYHDERRNIFKSTHAAAMYLKDLYGIFNDWELALAAYNAGEYKIIKAIRKGGSKEYDILTDKRLIPKETRNYLPKLLAVKTIEQNLPIYGLEFESPIPVLENVSDVSQTLTDAEEIEEKTRLEDLADAEEVDEGDDYVASSNNGVDIQPSSSTQPRNETESKGLISKSVIVDTKNKQDISINFGDIQTYKISYSVSLNDLANLIGYDEVSFRELNPDIKGPYIYANSKNPFEIYLPSQKVIELSKKLSESPLKEISLKQFKSNPIYLVDDERPRKKHKRKQSKHLAVLKTKSNIESNSQLKKNSLKARNKLSYLVKRGDNYYKIAAKFGVSLEELKVLNGNKKRIYPNDRIDIPARNI